MSTPTNWGRSLAILANAEASIDADYQLAKAAIAGARASIKLEWDEWEAQWTEQVATPKPQTARMVRKLRKQRMLEIKAFKDDVARMRRAKKLEAKYPTSPTARSLK